MSTDYPDDWYSRRQEIYRRDNYTCQNCGRRGGPYGNTELHAHHIVPKSKGGTHNVDNLQTLCKDCHDAIHHNDKMAPTAYGSNTSKSWVIDRNKIIAYSLLIAIPSGIVYYSIDLILPNRFAEIGMYLTMGFLILSIFIGFIVLKLEEHGIDVESKLDNLNSELNEMNNKINENDETIDSIVYSKFHKRFNSKSKIENKWVILLGLGLITHIIGWVLSFAYVDSSIFDWAWALMMLSWIVIPIALYIDMRQIEQRSEWGIYKIVLGIGSIIWFINVIVGFSYLVIRQRKI